MRGWRSLMLGVLLVAPACGSSGPTAEVVDVGLVRNFYVKAGSGDDNDTGTSEDPFQSITRALTEATARTTIYVAPGLYDEENGESFPLEVPADVRLLGDPGTNGNAGPQGTTISWAIPESDPVRVLMEVSRGVRVVGLRFVMPLPEPEQGTFILQGIRGTAIRSEGPDIEVEQCTFTGFSWGVRCEVVTRTGEAPTGCLIHRNDFHDVYGAVRFAPASASVRVSANWVSYAFIGFSVKGPGVDMGGGALGSPGGNVFACCLASIVAWHEDHPPAAQPPFTVHAQDNVWWNTPVRYHLEVPPAAFAPLGGDVNHEPGVTVVTEGAIPGALCHRDPPPNQSG